MNTIQVILFILLWFVLGIIVGYACYKVIRDDREDRNAI